MLEHQAKRLQQPVQILLCSQGRDGADYRLAAGQIQVQISCQAHDLAVTGQCGAIKPPEIDPVRHIADAILGKPPDIGGKPFQHTGRHHHTTAAQHQPAGPHTPLDLCLPFLWAKPVFHVHMTHKPGQVGHRPFERAPVAGHQHIRPALAQEPAEQPDIAPGIALTKYQLGVGYIDPAVDPLPASVISVHCHDLVAELTAKPVDQRRRAHLRSADRKGREHMQHQRGNDVGHPAICFRPRPKPLHAPEWPGQGTLPGPSPAASRDRAWRRCNRTRPASRATGNPAASGSAQPGRWPA